VLACVSRAAQAASAIGTSPGCCHNRNGAPPRSPRKGLPMFRWFENRLAPFPPDPPRQPPRSLYAFCRHYTRGSEMWLVLMALTTAGIALAELAMYAYLGALVDRLGTTTPEAFL